MKDIGFKLAQYEADLVITMPHNYTYDITDQEKW